MSLALLILGLLSCNTDSQRTSLNDSNKGTNQVPEIQEIPENITEENIPTDIFAQPNIPTVTSASTQKLPKKEDWKLIDSYTVPGADLMGVAAVVDSIIMLSDTVHSRILKVNLNSDNHVVIFDNMKVVFLNIRSERLMLPQYEKDSVFIYRGLPKVFKFQIPYTLDRPSGMDAFRIDDFSIVDRGNNQIVVNKGGNYSLVGTKGSGPQQFNNPSSIVTVGTVFLLVIQAISEFRKSV